MNTPSEPFDEITTFTDIEFDELIADLKWEIQHKRNQNAYFVSFERKVYSFSSETSWSVTVLLGDPDRSGNTGVSESRKFLHEALNGVFAKIPAKPNAEVILGVDRL